MVCYLLFLENGPQIELKIENNSKFTKQQEMFESWTINGAQEDFDPKTTLDRFGSFIVMHVVYAIFCGK